MAEQTADKQEQTGPKLARRLRKTRVGVVTSDKRDKTIRVRVETLSRHGRYTKYVRSRTNLQVHDERGEAREGDRVEVVECRPYSRTKHWRLARVLQRAEEGGQTAESIET
ncbi:MAG TPA: 30S ribosomal protein S17 [Phycisphaerae bacterium]|nr:30S ribosomal protein S17 [Phycisphaerae bacterium]